MIESSPTLSAASVICAGVIGAPDRPRPLTYLAAVSAVAPVAADGALIAKYKCWLRIEAVISAMIATNDSVSMPP